MEVVFKHQGKTSDDKKIFIHSFQQLIAYCTTFTRIRLPQNLHGNELIGNS